MAPRYDAIIVGGGHNGLVAAAYLARAGCAVVLLERRPIVGGACVTEEIGPGFRASTTSYCCTLLRPEIIRDLDLRRHGFDILPCPATFSPFPGGGHLLLGMGAREDAEAIARFSVKDAEAYGRFGAAMSRLAEFIRPMLAQTPPDLAGAGPGTLLDLLRLGRRFRRLSRSDQALLIKIMTISPMAFLDEWFESPQLKASLAAGGTIGVYGSPRTAATSFAMLHYYEGGTMGAPGLWGFVRGGMGGITQATAASARSFGAAIRTGAPVARIVVKDGAATGIVLEGGEEIAGRVIASGADPKVTFLKLVERRHLPEDFARGIDHLRCAGNSGKVNLALGEPPDFKALPGPGPHFRGAIQVAGDDPDYLEQAFDDYRQGRLPRRPYLDIVVPTLFDGTLAPPGRHVVSISIKYIPYRLAEGDWRVRRQELGDLAVATLAEYAPNVRNAVLHQHVLTPLDFEEEYGLTGGHIAHGDMALDQLYAMRPLYGWARYRTPVRNFYLCGSGAHPGGGVTGAPGRNAAREILKDLRRRPRPGA